jgi:hypothetical protein
VVLVRHPGTTPAAFAAKGLADLELQARHYSAAVAYYDAAVVLATRLGVPPPAPSQRIKAHLYAGRYRVLLGAGLVLIAATMLFLWRAPRDIAWRAQARAALLLALGLLPVFALLGGLAAYLASHQGEERPLNISGREPLFVAASYGLTVAATFLTGVIYPGFVSPKRTRPLFWSALALSLLAASYCIFYAFDLVYYLESLIYTVDPQTGLPKLPGL